MRLFSDAIIKITRTLTLLFISLHHNADARKRLGLEGSGLRFLQCSELAKKDVKPKMFLPVTAFSVLVILSLIVYDTQAVIN